MFNRRLLLIPAWLVARVLYEVLDKGSFIQGFEAATSLGSLCFSLVGIIAIVYYAMKAKRPEQAPKSAAPDK